MTPRPPVPVGPLREAFVRSGLTYAEVARRMGCNEAWVGRTLGSRSVPYPPFRSPRGVEYKTAVALCRAMNLDPVDVGL